MGNYVQAVVVQGKLYVGGGRAGLGSEKNYMVMEYDIGSGNWDTLPPYRAFRFAMTEIDHQLVLVGGHERGGSGRYSKMIGVWGTDATEWTHPYPAMPTARQNCSAAVSDKWLVAVGGYARQFLSCVEVLNTESRQWHVGRQTPIPSSCMKTAVVEDVAYFMGGFDGEYSETSRVLCVSLPV